MVEKQVGYQVTLESKEIYIFLSITYGCERLASITRTTDLKPFPTASRGIWRVHDLFPGMGFFP
jgi:hypothetical protein